MFRYIADDVLSLIIQNLVIMLITSIAYKETNNSLRNQLTYTNIIHPPLDFLYNFVQQYVIFKVLKEYCIPKEERKKLPITEILHVFLHIFLINEEQYKGEEYTIEIRLGYFFQWLHYFIRF